MWITFIFRNWTTIKGFYATGREVEHYDYKSLCIEHNIPNNWNSSIEFWIQLCVLWECNQILSNRNHFQILWNFSIIIKTRRAFLNVFPFVSNSEHHKIDSNKVWSVFFFFFVFFIIRILLIISLLSIISYFSTELCIRKSVIFCT